MMPRWTQSAASHSRQVRTELAALAYEIANTLAETPGAGGQGDAALDELVQLAENAAQDPHHVNTVVALATRSSEVAGTNGEKRTVTWENTNKLLDVEGYDGVKTGTTNAAGNCLIASGRRGSDHLLVVILGSSSGDGRYADARNLFRWAWRELGQRHERRSPAVAPAGVR